MGGYTCTLRTEAAAEEESSEEPANYMKPNKVQFCNHHTCHPMQDTSRGSPDLHGNWKVSLSLGREEDIHRLLLEGLVTLRGTANLNDMELSRETRHCRALEGIFLRSLSQNVIV